MRLRVYRSIPAVFFPCAEKPRSAFSPRTGRRRLACEARVCIYVMSALHQRVKLLLAFLVGATVTALLCNVSWLRGNYCVGDGCATVVGDTEPHFRRLLSFFTGTKNGSTTGHLPLMRHTNDNTSDGALNSSNMVLLFEQQPSSREHSHPQLTTPFTTSSPPASSASSPLLYSPQSKQQPTIPTLPHSRSTFSTPSSSDADQLISVVNRISLKCRTQNCREFLMPRERTNFNDCFKKCSQQRSKFGDIMNGTCRFMNGRGRLPVALASFPGSGNTWVRGLVEKVTGICTGEIIMDNNSSIACTLNTCIIHSNQVLV